MTLIIGGRGQGKLEYALKAYRLSDGDVSRELGDLPVIYGLQDIIRELLRRGGDPLAEILAHAAAHPEAIYICDEVGSGVIPVGHEERDWREAVGRCCTALAKTAGRVERVFCGIPMLLKEEGKLS